MNDQERQALVEAIVLLSDKWIGLSGGCLWPIRQERLEEVEAVLAQHETALEQRIVELQRARIGDSEIIGRWMCQAKAAEARYSDLEARLESQEEAWTESLAIVRKESEARCAQLEQRLKQYAIRADPFAIGELLQASTREKQQYHDWLLRIFRVAQKHFGDDAYRVDSEQFSVWLDGQLAALARPAEGPR